MRRAILLLLMVLLTMASEGFAQQQLATQEMLKLYEPRTFREMPYRLMKPIDLAEHPEKAYPLVLSLHGADGTGNDNLRNLRLWNRVMAEEDWRRAYPCFVVVPHSQFEWFESEMIPDLSEDDIERLPDAYRDFLKERDGFLDYLRKGELETVFELLDEVSGEFNIDANRVYVLGHSMGGSGAWNSIYQQPERFAAAIPTSGALVPWLDARRIRDVPIWNFHGSADPLVPVEFSRLTFDKLKALDGIMKYTELEDIPHEIEMTAFVYKGDDPDKGFITQYSSERCDRKQNVWDWLFGQKRI